MKKIISIFLILTIVVLFCGMLVACGSPNKESKEDLEQEENVAEEQDNAPAKLKVAMLLSGPISDQGWNATAYNGLKLIEKNLGAEISYTEKVANTDAEEVFRGYANQGYNIIFGHGFQYGDAAMKIAPEFPDVKFIITSTDISQPPNVASLNNDNKQQGFLSGVVAGLLTESKVVGMVGGMEIPSIINSIQGFIAGVKYIDPSIETLTTYIGDFEDAAKGKEIALAMINKGADIITHNADSAGLGVLEAAQSKGVKALGTISDQYELAPDVIVTSGLSDLTVAFEVVTKIILDGKFEPKMYTMGVKEGAVGLAPYYDFEDKIPEETKQKIQAILDDIKNDKLDVYSLVE